MASPSRQARKHRERQGRGHHARLYSPPPGARFAFTRHSREEFIRDPHTGAIMRLSTWRARYGKPTILQRAREVLNGLRPMVRVES